MSKKTEALAKLAMQFLNTEKQAFVPPPPPGGAPMMDPAMMGGAGMPPPMDPMMAGGMPPPMDPMMAGGMPPPMDPMMDPAMAGGAPPPEAPAAPPVGDIKEQVKEVLQETGVVDPDEKLTPDDSSDWLHQKLDAVISHLNIPMPPRPGAEEDKGEGEGNKGDENSAPGILGVNPGEATNIDHGSLPSPSIDLSSGAGGVPPLPGAPKPLDNSAKSAGYTPPQAAIDALARLKGHFK